jgi:hypothetical protein
MAQVSCRAGLPSLIFLTQRMPLLLLLLLPLLLLQNCSCCASQVTHM